MIATSESLASAAPAEASQPPEPAAAPPAEPAVVPPAEPATLAAEPVAPAAAPTTPPVEPAAATTARPLHVPAAEPPPPVTTRLGWALDFDGLVQIDAVPFSQRSVDEIDPSGTPLNETTIMVRRGYLRGIARRAGYFAELQLDANTVQGPATRIVTSYIGWEFATGALRQRFVAGLMKIPFGAAVPSEVRGRTFMEQPTFLRALFPGDYDAGVSLSGSYGFAQWTIAAMNGAPVQDAQWKGRDPAASYDLIARLGVDVALPHRGHVVAGVSALSGSGLHRGSPATKDELQWIDENGNGTVESTELMIVPGTPALPSKTFQRNALGLDAAAQWCLQKLGHGVLQFESAIATNLDRGIVYADPVARAREIRELGFSLGVIQHLGPWALAGVRYDLYQADRDANERQGVALVYVRETFSSVSVAAALHWNTARLTAQYDHNTNPFGRDDSGTPTTQRADRITVRGQVQF